MKKTGKVLLVGHRTGLGGADRYMLEQAELLLKYGYCVECIAFESGPLESSYKHHKIPCVIYPIPQLKQEFIYNLTAEYDLIIVNTMYAVFFAYEAQKYKPTMLILHDCLSYMKNIFIRTSFAWKELKQIRHLYGVSKYHTDTLSEIGLADIKVLNNFVKDTCPSAPLDVVNDKIIFLTVANWSLVKGYDLALKAFQGLSDEEKNLIEWHIVGKMEEEKKCVRFQNETEAERFIIFHGAIEEKKALQTQYRKCDVYLHLSREDACPLAVVDASMMGKAMIVSKDTGANYLAENGAGWIVDEYNSEKVTAVIREAVKFRYKLKNMGLRARSNYLANATPEAYMQAVSRESKRIIEKDNGILCGKGGIAKSNILNSTFSNLRIALYGYNMYAQIEYFYCEKYHPYELIGIYDRAYENFQKQGIEIKNPDKLKTDHFDFVCICCVFESTVQSIMYDLTEIGIPKEKISIGIKPVLESVGAERRC